MVKLLALYREPPNPEEFDRRFHDQHLALVRAYPGLRHLRVTRIIGSGIGEQKYRLMLEASFDSQESLDAALASPQGKIVSRDILDFAPNVTTLIGVTDD